MIPNKKELTAERLRELLTYDPDTGVFRWIKCMGGKAPAGSIAGQARPNNGYVSCVVDQRRYLNHRLAFLYMTGAWPINHVDHINGIKNDNRWANLRDLTCSENHHNLGGPRRNNKCGFLGVHERKDVKVNKYQALISVDGVARNLGFYSTPEAAHAAYLVAKDELHPTHQRLRQGDQQ